MIKNDERAVKFQSSGGVEFPSFVPYVIHTLSCNKCGGMKY